MYMLIAIAVTALVIALAWRGIGAQPSGEDPAAAQGRPGRVRPRSRTTAPDDDPEFLREIDRKLRGEDKSN